MALKEQLDTDLKSAMREKAQLKMDTIRMVKSAIKYREIELMKPLDDAGVLGVVASEIKRRKDSIEQYRAGKKTVAGFFVGQIMKASKGQANPALVNELLTKKLDG